MDKKKIISIDVGIKHLAYCVFHEQYDNSYNIVDWDIINLIKDDCVEKKCSINCKNKQICNKKAKYCFEEINGQPEQFYCEKHAKMSNKMLFTKECSLPQLKKIKLNDLKTIMLKNNIPVCLNDKKEDCVEKIFKYYDSTCLKLIQTKKQNANDVSLIDVGRNIKNEFQKILEFNNITHVIIENQISPIATRMKTIQGILAQYFIMKDDNIFVDFVSSSNKLKNFVLKTNKDNDKDITDSQKYKQHKIDSVVITKNILENNELFKKWLHVLETKKKDDLADCFLQGVWYLESNMKIKVI